MRTEDSQGGTQHEVVRLFCDEYDSSITDLAVRCGGFDALRDELDCVENRLRLRRQSSRMPRLQHGVSCLRNAVFKILKLPWKYN